MSAIELARPELRAMRGYSSARMEASGGRVFLNANESPWPQPDGVNRYPEPQPQALREKLACLYGVDAASVLVSRGSDEAIDLLTRAFCRAGQDAIVISPPTFGMYAICAEIQDAKVVRVPLRAPDFAYPFDGVAAAVIPGVKLVYVCAPNNPTGSSPPRNAILALAEQLRGRALVVVDEAYIEFSQRESLAIDAANGANCVVLRTLSKAYGLAGARIGALVGDPEIVALLQRIMPPYPLPTPSVELALAALEAPALSTARARIASLLSERQRLATALANARNVIDVLDSDANFLTVRFHDGRAVYRAALARGIVLRDVSTDPSLANCLRISIGLPEENDAVIELLSKAREYAA